jgi:hypothetical protein
MKSKKLIAMMVVGLVAMVPAASGVITSPPTAADDSACIDFEDLPLGTEYHVEDTFSDSGVVIDVQIFQLSDGRWYDDGRARVANRGYAGGSGQEMEVNNVNLAFDFGGSCEGVSLLFGEYGGNLNIKINGDFKNFNNFIDINGLTIGSVQVVVNDFGDDKGGLKLSGLIYSFAIGGQELVIDDVCLTVPAEKADLIITDVWSEDSIICYQIRNIGRGVAPAGHYTDLLIDGVHRISDYLAVDLAPADRLERCFDYEWVCTSPQDTVKVCADYRDDVTESDETNNCREEVWKCDVMPPGITEGPGLSEITTRSARISWDTDENSDSVVKYGRVAGKYDLEKKDSTLVRNHRITLTDLEPSTVYHFVVQSTDSSGNTAKSKDRTFETLASPDDEDPVVSIIDPGMCEGTVIISATASDNIGVKKVEFYVEGKLAFTDYSPPYEFPWDTSKCTAKSYTLGPTEAGPLPQEISVAVSARAFDVSDRFSVDMCDVRVIQVPPDSEPPSVEIVNPGQGDTVSGTITVEAEASDESGVNRVEFYVDDEYKSCDDTAPYTFNWNTQTALNGLHTVKAVAFDNALPFRRDSYHEIEVTTSNLEAPRPILELSRGAVTMHGNYFTVGLRVENVGTAEARNIVIQDYHRGFQPLSKTITGCDVVSSYSSSYLSTVSCAEVTYREPLGSGKSSFYIGVDLVPILFDDPVPYRYLIGASTNVTYEDSLGNRWTQEFSLPVFDAPVYSAFSSANYLIVTHPLNLFNLNPEADVNDLLSAMGELATHKNGVLGYLLYPPGSYRLQYLIEEGGEWSSLLTSGWTSNGYLLIVGEIEIVPAWNTRHRIEDIDLAIRCTDLPYANTAGDWLCPELSVGRIIGDSARQLILPIQTSIAVHEGLPGCEFDRSHALLVSGYPRGRSGASDEINFRNEVDGVGSRLADDGVVVEKLNTPDWASFAQAVHEFFDHTADTDVIHLAGHGSPASWDVIDTFDVWVEANPFGDAKPFVFASTCLSGQYAGHYSLAEAFLWQGAAVYIGATEVSTCCANTQCANGFYERWSAGLPVGYAFRNVKRAVSGSSFWHPGDAFYKHYWSTVYQLYGDPKYGWEGPPAASAAATAVEAQEPLSSLDVVVPDYEVTTLEGEDYVEIPEGDVLVVPGQPLVPFYTVSLDYPQGYEIEDITLTDRSGLITATGLNIPNAVVAIAGDESLAAMAWSEGSEWWPDGVSNWTILENPDGSTTLAIAICPFYYNRQTTDVKFYKNYSFDIDYTVSTVEISKLETDKHAYGQGERVLVDLEVNNSAAEANDVLVEAMIKAESSSEIVGGLLLHTLKGLAGPASFSPQWDSNGFEPGYYYVEVTLKDTDGNVLDRKTEIFRLGICSGEITSFTATPESFDIGDSIDLSLAFKNTGTVDITGTAVIRVQDVDGEVVQEFGHEFADLAPSDSVSFDDTWDTSGAEEGAYTIIAYVLYDAKSTDPVTTTVGTSDPPNTPSNPSPGNHATAVSVDTDLSWNGGDPDAGDTVSYDVYFGTSATPPLRETIGLYAATQSSVSYDPGTLSDNTKYYWKIVARDNHGVTREGPVWDFITGLPGSMVTWDLRWGLDADPASVNIYTYPGDAVAVTLADVEWSMPAGLLVWYYGGPTEGWRFYKKGWGAVNTLATLTPGRGYIGIVPSASIWEIPQG